MLSQAKIEVGVNFWGRIFHWACKQDASYLFEKNDGGLSKKVGWLRYGVAPRVLQKSPKNLDLKFALMWCLLNCLFLSIGMRYCLETLSIYRVDVAEEFTGFSKKLQKCWHQHFFHFGLFLLKNEEFSSQISFYV